MISRQEYMDIKQALDFSRHASITAGVVALSAAIFLSGVWLLTLHTTWAFLLAQPLFTICFLQNFALFHECVHDSAANKRWVNHLLGLYTSIFCFYPYFPFRFIHIEHHLWAGNLDKDPTLKAVKDFREGRTPENRVYAWAWKLWLPIGYIGQFIVFLLYPLALKYQGKLTRDKLWKSILSVGVMFTSYIGLHLWMPEIFHFSNFAIGMVLYWAGIELINYPHHLTLPMYRDEEKNRKLHPWEQCVVTRSCYYPKGISEFITLNFNFHTEHHFYPSLPWYRLRKVRELIREKLGNSYNEEKGIEWHIQNHKRVSFDVVRDCPPSDYLAQKFQ